jgi:hypothetical protein
MWQIENNPPWSVNGGIGTLEHLLGRSPTESEKSTAAAIMQWFGTNCGHGFIAETLKVCGYQLQFIETDRSMDIRRLQHANIWMDRGVPRTVEIERRGRRIELKYGEAGSVKDI